MVHRGAVDPRPLALGALLAVAALTACQEAGRRQSATPAVPVTTTTATPAPTPAATTGTPTTSPAVVEVPYRVERRTRDRATEGFAALVESTLSDPRGWSRAGFRLVRRAQAPLAVVLAKGPVVNRLCLLYETYGEDSCQYGPVVALNAERWRSATPQWTGDLDSYRRMLVNHEVGHLLGQRHLARDCPRPGRPAPVMAQQSTELDGCLPNPWPLEEEIEVAARHDRPLAPPFSR